MKSYDHLETWLLLMLDKKTWNHFVHLAGAVEYTNYTFAEG